MDTSKLIRSIAGVAATGAVAFGVSAIPADAAATKDCGSGGFPSAVTAKRTTCAVANRLEKAFVAKCENDSSVSAFEHCRPTIMGFHCRPSGDPYHYVYCRKPPAVVAFRLAE